MPRANKVVMTRARKDGLIVNFQFNTDGFGTTSLQNLSIVKPL